MLQILLLGPPEVSSDGRPIAVDTRKAIALLAYLVVERSATRDALAGLFWADATQERARATLRRTLSALRGATGAELIDADRNLVSLAGPVDSDIDTFNEELAATAGHGHDRRDVCSRCIPNLRLATDLYRGDFLQGFSVKASPEFEDWVRGVAESTRIKVGEAFNRLGTALAAAGDYPAAISAVTRWIELDPLHEPAHRFLMLLHAWAGDRPGAIEAYRNCVAVFEQELGVPPLEETSELYEAILDEDLPPAPSARRRVKAEPSPPRRQPPTALIDRQEELDAMRGALQAAVSGHGRVLAVIGPPWMGKTRLLEELATESAGQEVVVGRAFRMEQAIPYGVATQVLRGVAPLLRDDRSGAPDWAMAEIGRLVPDLWVGPTDGIPDRYGELRLLEAIQIVITALASTRPVMVMLDDVQWMDPASSAVFAYLGRRISGSPLLLVVAARTGDDLAPAAAGLVAGAEQTIDIGPLTAQHLLRLTGGDEMEARRLREQTGGVPLLVAEALTLAVGAETSPGMTRYMEARIGEVGDLGRQILTAAAVLNGICDAGLLRETSGRTDEEVVEAVEELVGVGLLREVPESGGLSFTLDALERVAYEATSLVRRRLLHRRAARALAERGRASTDPGLAAAVAAQYQAAGEPEAASWYHVAGNLARAVYANDSARGFYEASLALGDHDAAGLRLALGELAMTAGDYDRARQELTVAEALAGPETMGLIEHRLGEVERLLGRFDLATNHFEMALTDHPAPGFVLADWALLAHRTGDAEKALEMASRALKVVENGGQPSQMSRVHNILAVVTPDTDQALDHAVKAIALAGDDDLLRMAALNSRALLLADVGEVDSAVELVVEAIEIAGRTGHRHREAALWNHLADLQHLAGREDESRASLTKAVSLFADIDSGDLEPELWLLSRW